MLTYGTEEQDRTLTQTVLNHVRTKHGPTWLADYLERD